MDDTIELLKECNAGTRTAIDSIKQVINETRETSLNKLLKDYDDKHKRIYDLTAERLSSYNEEGKAPSPMSKAMSWMTINSKMLINHSDREIASLMADGCNMGIKTVSKYINQYEDASLESKQIADELIHLEQDFMDDLRPFM